MNSMEFYKAEALLCRENEWERWLEEIPYIEWPKGWLVKAVPPFSGAIIRYRITKTDLNSYISVYLDCYNRLGYYNAPYWEVYPIDGDAYRCDMNNTKSLLAEIRKALKQLKEPK